MPPRCGSVLLLHGVCAGWGRHSSAGQVEQRLLAHLPRTNDVLASLPVVQLLHGACGTPASGCQLWMHTGLHIPVLVRAPNALGSTHAYQAASIHSLYHSVPPTSSRSICRHSLTPQTTVGVLTDTIDLQNLRKILHETHQCIVCVICRANSQEGWADRLLLSMRGSVQSF